MTNLAANREKEATEMLSDFTKGALAHIGDNFMRGENAIPLSLAIKKMKKAGLTTNFIYHVILSAYLAGREHSEEILLFVNGQNRRGK